MILKVLQNMAAFILTAWIMFLGITVGGDNYWVWAVMFVVSGAIAGAIGTDNQWLIALLPSLPVAFVGLFGMELSSRDHPERALEFQIGMAMVLIIPAAFAAIVGRAKTALIEKYDL